jgi:predicted nucleic acid-binding protein
MAVLMHKYRDRPMDLADASLVATAERRGIRRIFTLDSDFHIYRLADGSALACLP